MLRIPWIKYIKNCCDELGRPDLFLKPDSITKKDEEFVKSNFILLKRLGREESEMGKPSVRRHLLLKTSMGIEPYLARTLTNHERFLLIRFRLDYFHLLLAVPKGSCRGQVLAPCGCNSLSPQDLLHFMFFCKFFTVPR